jgi:hypothetical protein
MGGVRDGIDEKLGRFLLAQRMFFTATAPSGADGHVNLSPKGIAGSFAVLGPRSVAYLDLTGSGAETIAHLRQNGRICLMFCAFEGPPRIVRLHGRGEVMTRDDARFAEEVARFPEHPAARSVVRVEVDRVSDSCGHGVPLMEYRGDRDQLERWALNRGEERLASYRAQKNATSIDGLPALSPGAGAQGE